MDAGTPAADVGAVAVGDWAWASIEAKSGLPSADVVVASAALPLSTGEADGPENCEMMSWIRV